MKDSTDFNVERRAPRTIASVLTFAVLAGSAYAENVPTPTYELEHLSCLVQHIDAYLEKDKDPLLIVLPLCQDQSASVENESEAELSELSERFFQQFSPEPEAEAEPGESNPKRKKYGPGMGVASVRIPESKDTSTTHSVVFLTKAELLCLKKDSPNVIHAVDNPVGAAQLDFSTCGNE